MNVPSFLLDVTCKSAAEGPKHESRQDIKFSLSVTQSGAKLPRKPIAKIDKQKYNFFLSEVY